MLKLSKKIEYGLIAITHIAKYGQHSIITAKEISDKNNLSFELLSKVLQQLVKSKIVSSNQGIKGGYFLISKPEEISLLNIIHSIDGVTPGIVECISSGPEKCAIENTCTIKSPLIRIQQNLEEKFYSMKISQIM